MILDIEKVIKKYIPEVIHMSLSTCRNNKPWTTEVHFSYDKNLNLYFVSKPTTRHSQEIRLNPNVSGNIVKQFQKGEKPRGVYFEGYAEEMKDITKDDPAFTSYHERFGVDEGLLEDIKKEDGHKIYKIVVNKFFVFDAQESKPQRKYETEWPINYSC